MIFRLALELARCLDSRLLIMDVAPPPYLPPKVVQCLLIFALLSCCNAQSWTQSVTAGTKDLNGKTMGESEVLHLVGHKNKLYAAVGYWQHKADICYGGACLRTGWAQILRLDKPDGKWQVDHELGPFQSSCKQGPQEGCHHSPHHSRQHEKAYTLTRAPAFQRTYKILTGEC